MSTIEHEFVRFPRTPHLLWLSNASVRDDKVMTETERAAFLRGPVVVEEKIDGANVGISFSADLQVRVQNRGQWLSGEGGSQFMQLSVWLRPRCDRLFDALETRRILFGEWCYARHSVGYDQLPDWFLGFDVYDHGEQRFWSTRRRNELLRRVGVTPVPFLCNGEMREEDLKKLLSCRSAVGSAHLEGIYLRSENDDFLEDRAKLVRPEFLGQIGEHWTRMPMHLNRVAYEQLTSPTKMPSA